MINLVVVSLVCSLKSWKWVHELSFTTIWWWIESHGGRECLKNLKKEFIRYPIGCWRSFWIMDLNSSLKQFYSICIAGSQFSYSVHSVWTVWKKDIFWIVMAYLVAFGSGTDYIVIIALVLYVLVSLGEHFLMESPFPLLHFGGPVVTFPAEMKLLSSKTKIRVPTQTHMWHDIVEMTDSTFLFTCDLGGCHWSWSYQSYISIYI